MARTLLTLWILGPLVACSGRRIGNQDSSAGPSSQETYEYANCPNYTGDCPREGTLACALKAIIAKYNSCSMHEDCVAAVFKAKCSGAGACPPFYVNRQLKAGFEAEAQREIDRYCETARCRAGGPCGVIGTMEAYCADSRCTLIRVFAEAGPRLIAIPYHRRATGLIGPVRGCGPFD